MSMRLLTGIVSAAALLAVASLLESQTPAPGQSKAQAKGGGGLFGGPAAPTGPAPKLADGTPDLSGVWRGGGGNDSDISNPRGLKPGDKVVMLPWAEALMKTRLSKEDPEANCLPSGIPR